MRCIFLKGRYKGFLVSRTSKIAFFDLIVGNNEKNEENEKVAPLNRETFSFSSFFSRLPPLNHKSRFSRSVALKKSEVSIRRADIKFF